MAHHLPVLEVCGERIPTPIDWTREEHSLGHISSPDSTDDLLINDVETPYMVESWLQGLGFKKIRKKIGKNKKIFETKF